MALSPTELQAAVLKAGNRYFTQFENRISTYGGMKAHLDNADKLLPASMIEQMKNSPSQVVKFPVLNKFASTIETSLSCTPTADEQTSAFKALTWLLRSFTVSTTEVVNQGNYISVEEQFMQGYQQGLKALFAAIDTLAIANLETNKSAVLAATTLATGTTANYVYANTDWAAKKLYTDIPAIMALNDLSGPFIDVFNTEERATALAYQTLGANNSTNLAGTLNGTLDGSGQYMMYSSNRLAAGTGNSATHYIAPEGSIGLFTWNDWESRTGKSLGEFDKKYIQADPVFGIPMSVHERTTCVANGTGTNYQTVYEFSLYLAFATAYSSDTTSPIVKLTVDDGIA